MNRLLVHIWFSLLLTVVGGVCAADQAGAARGHEFGLAVGWGVRDGKPELETCTAVTGCKHGIVGSGKGQFKVPVGVAVNEASGDFYVVDEANGRVERFGADGEYLGEFDGSGIFEVEGEPKEEVSGKPPPAPLLRPRTIAVDNSCVQEKLSESRCKEVDPSAGDVYVVSCGPPGTCEVGDVFHDVVDKFTPAGEYVGQVPIPVSGQGLIVMGVAVDAEGDLWIAEDQGLEHLGFDEFNKALANGQLKFVPDKGLLFARPGLALGSGGDLYAVWSAPSPLNELILAFTPRGEALGVVSMAPARGVATEWKSGDVYVDVIHSIERMTAGIPAIKIEEFGEGLLVDGRGVAAASTVVAGVPEREGPVYVADAGAADVALFPLEKPKKPTVEGVSVSAVTSESVTMRAVVNPRGARSEYRFEYGVCSSPGSCGLSPFEVSVPSNPDEGKIGVPFDFEAHEVSIHPQRLKADTTYHLRVSVRNEKNEPAEFVQSGEVVFRTEPVSVEPLLDGRGWEMVSPPRKHGSLIRQIGEQDVIQASSGGSAFTFVTETPTEDEPHGFSNFVQVLARRTRTGWVSEDLALSHMRATGQSIGAGLEYRFFNEDLSTALVQPFGAFEPVTSPEATEQTPYERTNFVAGEPEAPCSAGCYRPLMTAGNVREGAAFGEEGKCPEARRLICGPRIVGASPDGQHVIVSSPVGLTETSEDKGGLYEWSNGSLSLVSILPSGKPAPGGNDPVLGEEGVARGAVSKDGSRVVWFESHSNALYLRDIVSGETLEVNKGLTGTPIFQAASADGSRVFFEDVGGLYVYETEKGQAIKLTIPIEAEEQAEIHGDIVGVSQDGTYVYFVANGRLNVEAQQLEHPCGGSGSSGERCFLYEVHFAGGTWETPRVVAILSGADFPDFAGGLSKLTARVSPNGRWLVFMSQLRATGYDNRDAISGALDEEVFLYDSENGKLVCVSCNPTGARPVGVEASKLHESLVATAQAWRSTEWLAANVPGWTPYELDNSFYQSRYLLDDGRVFFNANDALVPRDVNGTEDVYEYEPQGIGSCTSSSPSYVEASKGCVSLISTGTSRQESAFLDASASGSDVFFLTASKLVSSDFDSALDVYDAHECSTSSPCQSEPPPSPQVCVTEASCKAPPKLQPEGFDAPASAAFTGVGNLLPTPRTLILGKTPPRTQLLFKALSACRHIHRHSKQRRSACERHARTTYAVTAAKRDTDKQSRRPAK